VVVGGQVAELLVTDASVVRMRPTDDVGVVVPVTTRRAYHDLQMRLIALGFAPDQRAGDPICGMRTVDDSVLDVMPLDEAIFGFSSGWYPYHGERYTVHARARIGRARCIGCRLSGHEVGRVCISPRPIP